MLNRSGADLSGKAGIDSHYVILSAYGYGISWPQLASPRSLGYFHVAADLGGTLAVDSFRIQVISLTTAWLSNANPAARLHQMTGQAVLVASFCDLQNLVRIVRLRISDRHT